MLNFQSIMPYAAQLLIQPVKVDDDVMNLASIN